MVGGGRGAFIGQIHRMAANLDGKIELIAGAFSSSPEKSKLSGEDFFLDPSRVYGSYQEMATVEAAREDGIDFVSMVVQIGHKSMKSFVAGNVPFRNVTSHVVNGP